MDKLLWILFCYQVWTFSVDSLSNKKLQELKFRLNDETDDFRYQPNLELDESWPKNNSISSNYLLTGVSFNPNTNDLVVLHRSNREWTETTFDNDEIYTGDRKKPISTAVILTFASNRRSLSEKPHSSYGSKLFHLPHGISVDSDGNTWVTDVALHQVFKFPPGSKVPTLVLGEAFTPGRDSDHFCKPTHAVAADGGSFFVADGYCNSRLIKYDSAGRFINEIGLREDGSNIFNVVHHLALLEDKNQICAADRHHLKVRCYEAGLRSASGKSANFPIGDLEQEISTREVGPVYAIAYNPIDNQLYALGQQTESLLGTNVAVYDLEQPDRPLHLIRPSNRQQGFGDGHSMAFNPATRQLVVSAIHRVCPFAVTDTCGKSEERNIWLFN